MPSLRSVNPSLSVNQQNLYHCSDLLVPALLPTDERRNHPEGFRLLQQNQCFPIALEWTLYQHLQDLLF